MPLRSTTLYVVEWLVFANRTSSPTAASFVVCLNACDPVSGSPVPVPVPQPVPVPPAPVPPCQCGEVVELLTAMRLEPADIAILVRDQGPMFDPTKFRRDPRHAMRDQQFVRVGRMALVTGMTVLAPAAVPLVVSALTRPARVSRGALALLIRQGALAAPRRPVAGVPAISVTLPAGRHEYAFLVEEASGTVRWMRDPFAPPVRDEYGTESSVVTVGGTVARRS